MVGPSKGKEAWPLPNSALQVLSQANYYVMLIRGVDGEGAFDKLGRAEVARTEKQLFSCVS